MKDVLVVVDMQNDFIDQALGSKEAMAIVDYVADKIKAFEGFIVVTYDTHDENYMDSLEGKYLPVPHCIKGSEGWQLNNKIQAALANKEYITIEKPTFGAMNLPEVIEQNTKVKSIEVCGLCSDICVVSNALLLKAYFKDVDISLDSRACAGVTPQSHEAALTTMRMCQINVK